MHLVMAVQSDMGENSHEKKEVSGNDILHLELFLTGTAPLRGSLDPFLTSGRPDFEKTFLNMQEEAIKKGEKRIVVCVCAPAVGVDLCETACAEYSDRIVRFDFHAETFE